MEIEYYDEDFYDNDESNVCKVNESLFRELLEGIQACSLKELEYYTDEIIESKDASDLCDKIDRVEYDDGTVRWLLVDLNGNELTEIDVKERRLELKRAVIRRELELGVDYSPGYLRKMFCDDYYRENQGYNKFGEWCCSKCKQYKPRNVEFFPKDSRRTDGLGYTCRECLKKYSKDRYYTKIKPAREQKSTEQKKSGIDFESI